MRLPGLVDPLVVESRQQLAVAEIDGLLQPPLPNEPVEFPRVHEDDVAGEPDHVTRRHEDALALGAKRVPDGDELGSQALARARIEHLGPEAAGDLRARVHAGMQRQPAEQRARPPTLGRGQCDAVRLERQAAEQAHSEHDAKAIRGPSSRATREAFAFVWRSCGARGSGSRRKRQAGGGCG